MNSLSMILCLLFAVGYIGLTLADTCSDVLLYDFQTVVLNGVKTTAYTKSDTKYSFAGEFTVCSRFEMDPPSFAFYVPFDKGSYLGVAVQGKPVALMINGMSDTVDISDSGVTSDPTFMCIAFDWKNVYLYLNGRLQYNSSVDNTRVALDSHRPIERIKVVSYDHTKKLTVSDVRYYDKVLSSDDVYKVSCEPADAPKDLIDWDQQTICVGDGTGSMVCPSDPDGNAWTGSLIPDVTTGDSTAETGQETTEIPSNDQSGCWCDKGYQYIWKIPVCFLWSQFTSC